MSELDDNREHEVMKLKSMGGRRASVHNCLPNWSRNIDILTYLFGLHWQHWIYIANMLATMAQFIILLLLCDFFNVCNLEIKYFFVNYLESRRS